MGVCKCKQRNVTNQFCYVCRMNVCESCIVKDHQRCIIKSYVNWLQDSDYSETCSLCLESVKSGELIRLSCYDLFHWDCFNKWALKFPEKTNSSNFKCPDCKAAVFPPNALVSPVADVVRQKFATVAWGRRGLGMKPVEAKPNRPITPEFGVTANVQQTSTSTPISSYNPPITSTIKTPFVPLPKHTTSYANTAYTTSYANTAKYEAPKVTRKVYDTTKQEAKIDVSFDHDNHKYKRKGITHWIKNLLKLNEQSKPTTKSGNTGLKRALMLLITVVTAFIVIVMLMSNFGRDVANTDPLLDPNLNPNIRIADQQLSPR